MPDEDIPKPLTNQSANAMTELMAQEPAPEIPDNSAVEEGAKPEDRAAEPQSNEGQVPSSPTQEDSAPDAAKPEGDLAEGQSKPEGEAAPSKPEESEAFKKWKEENLDTVKLRSDAHPRTTDQFNQVKTKSQEQFLRAQALEEKLAALEAEKQGLASKVEEVQKQFSPEQAQRLQELEEFYQNYGMIDDPKWTEPYDQKIKSHDEAIVGLLRQRILPEGSAKYIMEHGGPSKFRYSSEPMPASFKNEDGSPMTHNDYWSKYIDGSQYLSQAEREEMDDLFREIRGVSRDKNQKVADVQKNRSTYVQQSQQQAEAAQKEWNQRVQAHVSKYAESLGDVAKLRDIPANATVDEKASIERHNSRITRAKEIAENLAPRIANEPEAYIEAVIDASRAKVMDDVVKETEERATKAEKRAEELQKQLDQIKKSSSTVSKSLKPSDKPKGPPRGASSEEIMKGYMQEAGELKR